MTVRKRIARVLIEHAVRCLPTARREWGEAMRAELEYVARDRLISWAFGCVLACYAEKRRIMNRSNFLVSKFVVGLETLVCFGPLTLLWLIAVARLDDFIGYPRILFDIALATMAPICLVVAIGFVFFGKRPHRKLLVSIGIIFSAIGVLMIAGKYLGPNGHGFMWGDVEWSLPILFSALPALCCWHLSMFAKIAADKVHAA